MNGIVWIDSLRPGLHRFPRDLRAELDFQRLDILGFGGYGRRCRRDIAALRGAGQQKSLQYHGAENPAPHMAENTAQIVGAEAGGEGGKAGVIDPFREHDIQTLAVAEQDADDAEDGADKGRHGFAGPVLAGCRAFGYMIDKLTLSVIFVKKICG